MSLTDLLYGGGSLAASSPEASSPKPPDPDVVKSFIAEAKLALRGGVARWLVCVVASDERGLVAAISRAIAELKLNVEAAHQMTAGGQAILSFTVSSDSADPLARAELRETLDAAGIDWGAATYVLGASPVEEPVPTGLESQWSATLTGSADEHTSTLVQITAGLGKLDWPVVALNSLVVDDEFELQISFATSGGVSAQAAAQPLLAVDAGARLRVASGSIGVTSDLLRQAPKASAPNGGLLWVTGIAKPGFLSKIFEVVAKSASSVSVVSMAILEGHTVALIGVEVAPGLDPVDLGRDIEDSVDHPQLRAEHLKSSMSGTGTVHAQHELYVVHGISSERPGVIAEIATLIADAGGNICRISARVVGSSRPTDCEVAVALWLDPAKFPLVAQSLEEARHTYNWTTCFIEPYPH